MWERHAALMGGAFFTSLALARVWLRDPLRSARAPADPHAPAHAAGAPSASAHGPRAASPSVREAVRRVFPFSFVAGKHEDAARPALHMRMEHLPALAALLKDDTHAREAFFAEMLMQRMARLFVEKDELDVDEVHACLWVILRGVLQLGAPMHELLLQSFRIDALFLFLRERPRRAAWSRRRPSAATAHAVEFQFPHTVVWLAFSVLARLFHAALDAHVRGTPPRAQCVVPTMLASDEGRALFRRFLAHAHTLLRAQDGALLNAALLCTGELLATCPRGHWAVRDVLHGGVADGEREPARVLAAWARVAAADDADVLAVLGRLLFTALQVAPAWRVYVRDHVLVNEVILLAIHAKWKRVQLVFLDVLYLLALDDEAFATLLVQNEEINVLRLCHAFVRSSDRELAVAGLQLLTALAAHGAATCDLVLAWAQSPALPRIVLAKCTHTDALVQHAAALCVAYLCKTHTAATVLLQRYDVLATLCPLVAPRVPVPVQTLAVDTVRHLATRPVAVVGALPAALAKRAKWLAALAATALEMVHAGAREEMLRGKDGVVARPVATRAQERELAMSIGHLLVLLLHKHPTTVAPALAPYLTDLRRAYAQLDEEAPSDAIKLISRVLAPRADQATHPTA